MTERSGDPFVEPDPGPGWAHGPAQPPSHGEEYDRRTFLKRGTLATATLAAGAALNGFTQVAQAPRGPRVPQLPSEPSLPQPNILTIIVDQLRTPVWMPPTAGLAAVMPNLAALRARSVSFENHHTASNDCSPSRSVLLTGLYTHQTGVMITGASWLNPRFPTWGALLRHIGYETAFYGKWHLNPNLEASLSQYGFSGGTYPSPNGSPGQGTRMDPVIADQFVEWFEGHGSRTPWATTVSFVNPHDLAWWHRFTERIEAEANPPQRALSLPPNFETPEQLAEKRKPELQRSLQDTAARSFGPVPFTGPNALAWWTQMMDTYLLLQSYVDLQIGRVLATLASNPKVAANTVIVFTSDHGEYCGSHGLRGKGASAYEEALRVPLYVYDPRGLLTTAPDVPRTQLTSSADVVPLMLTIGWGSDQWRQQAEYVHLAGRHDLAKICSDPHASGRAWAVHATDEDLTEFASEPYAANAARHMIALRTPRGKLALYTNWRPGTIEPEPVGQEVEFYDYSTREGRLELSSQFGAGSALKEELWSTLEQEAIPLELRAPVPTRLHPARRQGFGQYFTYEESEAIKVYESHRREAPEPVPETL
jgi:arylsulfatase A-like enzyme